MDFHFIRYLWNEMCVFISPSLWRGDMKHTTSFINTVWNENSFQILFITCLTSKNVRKLQIYRFLLPILLRKTRQSRRVIYDVIDKLRRLGLSKSCSVLCHKLIYDIAIFHSINGESCDKIFVWFQSLYNTMTSEYGIPEWACYIIFAIITIITYNTVVCPVPNNFPVPNNLNWRVSHTFKWQCWWI